MTSAPIGVPSFAGFLAFPSIRGKEVGYGVG